MSGLWGRIAIAAILAMAIVAVLLIKGQQGNSNTAQTIPEESSTTASAQPAAPPETPAAASSKKTVPSAKKPQDGPAAKQAAAKPVTPPAQLPRLLELGSDSCRPCQMMQPVLEALRREYAGKLTVDFIDVWQDEAAGRRYNVGMIPTQIFFDAHGKEIYRHEGYFAKEGIVTKFQELGVKL